MKYLKYSGQIIIAIAVIVAILVFFGPCGNRKISQQYKQLQAENKALQDRVTADSITRANQRIAETAQIAAARTETEAAKADVKAADKRLSATQATVVQLAHRLQQYKNTPDTPAFTDYANNCDTLAAKVIEQDKEINQYKAEVDEAVDLLNYEVLLRDSVIEKEKAYSDSLRVDFNRQSALLKTALSAGKPRGKLLAGAGVIGNQINPLYGAKVAIAYQTKGGKQYQVGGVLIGGTVYYEGSVLIQIFK